MITCTKTYPELPFAHRQHRHTGRCSRIHGHNWTLTLTFACTHLDPHGFVVDFGSLAYLRDWLDEHLDHACVLAADDPLLPTLRETLPTLFRLHVAPAASCEGIARHLHEQLDPLVRQHEDGRAWITRVELYEDSRNAACYVPEHHPEVDGGRG